MSLVRYIGPIYTAPPSARATSLDIRTACLGILSTGDATGYDIKQRCERICSHFFAAGYGSIYPALGDLARTGLVHLREESGGGHTRKVYSLTEAGRRELRTRLENAEPRHRVHSDFALLMFFAELLAPERVEAMIEQRLDEIRAQLDRLNELQERGRDFGPGVEFTSGLGLAALGATARYLEANREPFLASLRKRRRGGDLPFHHSLTGDPE